MAWKKFLKKCANPKCKVCNKTNIKDTFVQSHSTRHYIQPYIKEGTNCKTSNIIYLINCKKCGVQYVGETKRNLNIRMNEHIRSVNKKFPNTRLVEHYNTTNHSIDDMKFQILDSFDNLNIEKQTRTDKELFWIKLLNTAFPYGLNDQIKGYGNISDSMGPFQKISHPYWKISISKINRNRKKRRSCKHPFSQEKRDKLHTDLGELEIKEAYKIVMPLPKKEKRLLINYISGATNLDKQQCLELESILANDYWNKCQYENKKMQKNVDFKIMNLKMEYCSRLNTILDIQSIVNKEIRNITTEKCKLELFLNTKNLSVKNCLTTTSFSQI